MSQDATADSDQGDSPVDDRGAIDHLQAAALELIAAARSVLDAAEEVVADPDAMRQATGALTSVARLAAKAGRNAVGADDGSATGKSGADDDEGPVQHIKVE